MSHPIPTYFSVFCGNLYVAELPSFRFLTFILQGENDGKVYSKSLSWRKCCVIDSLGPLHTMAEGRDVIDSHK